MKLTVKNMPYGDLPYTDLALASKMMLKLFAAIPYLPNLPKINPNDKIERRTLHNMPGIREKEGKYFLLKDFEKLKKEVSSMDSTFNNFTDIDNYSFETVFLDNFFKIIEKAKPKHAIVNFLGAFTISQILKRDEIPELITDRFGRKLLIQTSCLKAMWILKKIRELSPNTIPIVLFEEPKLNQFGLLKRTNDEVDKEQLTSVYTKIVEKMHEHRALVGVQCFEKCDWQILLDSGMDILSFDAFSNPNNIAIIAEKINVFLECGGYINWGIIPAKSESVIKNFAIDALYAKFINTVENTVSKGVSAKLIYNRASVSVQSNLDKLPIMFAEKALIYTEQLAKRIPVIK